MGFLVKEPAEWKHLHQKDPPGISFADRGGEGVGVFDEVRSKVLAFFVFFLFVE